MIEALTIWLMETVFMKCMKKTQAALMLRACDAAHMFPNVI
jgi:hypothetical protein